MMQYLSEILGFYDSQLINPLTTGQIALWHGLMYINNKCNWSEWFTAANQTLELITGLNKSSIVRNRNVLKQNGLIDFRVNGTRATSYKMLTRCIMQRDVQRETQRVCNEKRNDDATRNATTMQPLNRQRLDKDKRKEIIKEKPARHKYGQYQNVLLSDSDLEKLKTEFGDWSARIERLSEYMRSTGKSYKDHLATIRAWARRDSDQPRGRPKDPALDYEQRQYTQEDYESRLYDPLAEMEDEE